MNLEDFQHQLRDVKNGKEHHSHTDKEKPGWPTNEWLFLNIPENSSQVKQLTKIMERDRNL